MQQVGAKSFANAQPVDPRQFPVIIPHSRTALVRATHLWVLHRRLIVRIAGAILALLAIVGVYQLKDAIGSAAMTGYRFVQGEFAAVGFGIDRIEITGQTLTADRDIITLLIDAAEGRLTVRKLADSTTADARPVQVLEISGPQLDRVRLFVDQQMLIVGQAYSVPGPPAAPGQQPRSILSEEVFSDYRLVNGIRVPFEAQLLQNGQPVLKRTITRVSFNEAVPDSLFNKPS